MTGDFSFPTHVVFGPGRVRELPELVRGWGRRALIVTDPGVIAGGAVRPPSQALSSADLDYQIFDGVDSNPTLANIESGVRRFEESCDYLIAVGGGSVLDAAKAIRLMATHEGPLLQYVEQEGGMERIRPDMPPLVAIPTTAGTGSEVGRSTVVTIDGRKRVIFSPHLIPTVTVCDPELTLDLPATITAATGADALTHCVEAYFSKGFHPMCDAIALDGARRVMKSLATAVRDGLDMEARSEMMAAAMMGAVAFQKGLGVAHSLAHPLSTVAGIHHGLANALVLPHVLRFNREAIARAAPPMSHAMGVPAGTGEEAVEKIVDAVIRLFVEIGLPSRLMELNVTTAMIPRMADLAMEDGCHLCNPRSVSRSQMEALYRAAL